MPIDPPESIQLALSLIRCPRGPGSAPAICVCTLRVTCFAPPIPQTTILNPTLLSNKPKATMIGTLLSGTIALIFPLFASYRALVSNDISLIRPWLMYWVVFASFQFTESMFGPVLQLLPFYGFARLGVLTWMVLPHTQGAVQLYQTYLEPWLSKKDHAIDNTIDNLIGIVRNSPLQIILSLLNISLPKSPPPGPGGANASSNQASITDSIMSQFRLPASSDFNLAAYLPSILGTDHPHGSNAGVSSEASAAVRNRLLGLVRSLDSHATAGSASNEPVISFTTPSFRETDGYDFIETPIPTPAEHTGAHPGPGSDHFETGIGRETVRKQSQASSSAQPTDARRRWF